MFKTFKSIVDNQISRRIKCLRSERGGEFISEDFFYFCEKHGIRRKLSLQRTP